MLTNVCIHKRGYTIGKVLIEKSKQFWLCRHSLVDSSAPSILPPGVRVSSILTHFFQFILLKLYICHLNWNENRTKNKKRPGLAHLKKKYTFANAYPYRLKRLDLEHVCPFYFKSFHSKEEG